MKLPAWQTRLFASVVRVRVAGGRRKCKGCWGGMDCSGRCCRGAGGCAAAAVLCKEYVWAWGCEWEYGGRCGWRVAAVDAGRSCWRRGAWGGSDARLPPPSPLKSPHTRSSRLSSHHSPTPPPTFTPLSRPRPRTHPARTQLTGCDRVGSPPSPQTPPPLPVRAPGAPTAADSGRRSSAPEGGGGRGAFVRPSRNPRLPGYPLSPHARTQPPHHPYVCLVCLPSHTPRHAIIIPMVLTRMARRWG
jgi:hypothetical protein